MIMKLYTIKNEASQMFVPPLPCVNDNHAKQTFKQIMLKNEDNRIAAEEMNLYYTGADFDEASGTIINKDGKLTLIEEGKIYARKEIDWNDIFARNPETIQTNN